jgi:hypothetical protein
MERPRAAGQEWRGQELQDKNGEARSCRTSMERPRAAGQEWRGQELQDKNGEAKSCRTRMERPGAAVSPLIFSDSPNISDSCTMLNFLIIAISLIQCL